MPLCRPRPTPPSNTRSAHCQERNDCSEYDCDVSRGCWGRSARRLVVLPLPGREWRQDVVGAQSGVTEPIHFKAARAQRAAWGRVRTGFVADRRRRRLPSSALAALADTSAHCPETWSGLFSREPVMVEYLCATCGVSAADNHTSDTDAACEVCVGDRT